MKSKLNYVFTLLMLFLLIFSISSILNNKSRQNFVLYREHNEEFTSSLQSAGYWNNFTFIHLTNLNWTIANESDWCSGKGTWKDPYVIENMVINASDSPIGCGILIENSINAYFTIKNVTVYEGSNGIMLENTNNGEIMKNILLDNLDSGIKMISSANNTLVENIVMNNGLCGINLTYYCDDNRIFDNIIKNEGTNSQDTGIRLQSYCNNNDILGNMIYDNNVYGINIEYYCEENLIANNTLTNLATNQQDYGIRLHSDCNLNIISQNLIEDVNNYAIYMVTSDQNSVLDNQMIDCNMGMYMLIDYQSVITGNVISGGSNGIIMSACDGGEIANNFINETGNFAIRIFINSDNNEFYNNIIKDNTKVGIQLDDPSDTNNKFYKNSFISNGLHAYDNGTTSTWNNTIIGNYWDNYTGLDLNYDNAGDSPFPISGAANATDDLPLVDHWSPIILTNSPISGSSYGNEAPEFNILVNNTYIYSMWYTINYSSAKHYFMQNGTINQDAWNALSEGSMIITFYGRDITWNVDSESVTLYKDITSPTVSIVSPTVGEFIGINAPTFVVEIKDSVSPIGSKWYTINYSSTKHYFTENGTIDQDAWNALSDGDLIITFFGQDVGLNLKNESVSLTKDTVSPIVTIISPVGGENVGVNAPSFVVEISDSASAIGSMWYTINYSTTKHYFTENGTIDQYTWSALSDDDLIITFYAQDLAQNVNSKSVALIKDTSQSPNDGNNPPPLDLLPIIIVSTIIISAIILVGIMMRVTLKGRARNEPKLNEEQQSKAQYFKDITSILTILAIHNETGLCLSKIALHEGIGLDEHLFTGFISAIGSFKNELAKQMGLGVRERIGDNIIEYNEFTITLMDGEYLRLGLVSHSNLGDLIKRKCGQALRDYEMKHLSELKAFDGDIQKFKDFKEEIEKGLEMNLNKKCRVNLKQLHKPNVPDSLANILKGLNARSGGFFPIEIAASLIQQKKLSDQEAYLMVYEAYENHIILPE